MTKQWRHYIDTVIESEWTWHCTFFTLWQYCDSQKDTWIRAMALLFLTSRDPYNVWYYTQSCTFLHFVCLKHCTLFCTKVHQKLTPLGFKCGRSGSTAAPNELPLRSDKITDVRVLCCGIHRSLLQNVSMHLNRIDIIRVWICLLDTMMTS